MDLITFLQVCTDQDAVNRPTLNVVKRALTLDRDGVAVSIKEWMSEVTRLLSSSSCMLMKMSSLEVHNNKPLCVCVYVSLAKEKIN